MPDTVHIVAWNLNHRTGRQPVPMSVVDALKALDADVVVLTEVGAPLVAELHRVTSGPDYGYGLQEKRRKVVLWSRHPWDAVDVVGDPKLPPGRFVAATTVTPLGPLGPVWFVGVCIPWRAAHVSTGRKDRAQ